MSISFAAEAKPKLKDNQQFAPSGKYGRLRTKQAKPAGRRDAYIFRQWRRC